MTTTALNHEPALVDNVSILSSFTASMRDRGLDVEMRLLRQEKRRAFVVLERLGVVEGEPVALFASQLSTKRFPGIGDKLAQRGSLWDVLEQDFGGLSDLGRQRFGNHPIRWQATRRG